ncbi:MAG TPA: recombinase family protein [Mycobacterium sp.]|nr:recombinase family protein [Mycobacterium sp.]
MCSRRPQPLADRSGRAGCRCSPKTASDPTGQQLDVARQREDCLTLCATKGWEPVEYVDNDVSATSGRPRPAYQRMLADIRDGALGGVVAWDLDRL